MPNNLQDNIILDTPGSTPIPNPVPIPEKKIDEPKPAETPKIEQKVETIKPVVEPTPKYERIEIPKPVESVQIPPLTIEETPVTPLPPKINNQVRKAPVSANPDVEGYLFNKSTIGGIDQSRLEYKETFKDRIYISKPDPKYSWIVLGVLIVAAISGGIYYYFKVLIAPTPMVIDNTSVPSQTIIEETTPTGPAAELLKLQLPAATTDDTILTTLRNATNQTNVSVVALLNKDLLDKIPSEFRTVQQIIMTPQSNTNPEIQSQTKAPADNSATAQ